MISGNIQTLFQKYNNHFEEWKRVQAGVQVNLKGLAIILQKFLLFNVNDAEGEGVNMVDRIIKSYQNKNDESDVNVMENYSEIFEEDSDLKVDSLPSESPLLCALLVNHPGTINLFLQKQSNKLLQLLAEISCVYMDFRSKHLEKMKQIYQECEIIVNRNINKNIDGIQDQNQHDLKQISNIMDVYNGISKEMDDISIFCLSMDIYPKDEDKIKKYLDFLENFKFFKN